MGDRAHGEQGRRRVGRSSPWIAALGSIISATALIAAGGAGVASASGPAAPAAASAAVGVSPHGGAADLTTGLGTWASPHRVGRLDLAAPTGKRSAAPSGRTIAVGNSPASVAIDQATHTAYVGNGNDGTVSVIDTATCNARVARGCGQTSPTIKVGQGPVDDVVDQATDTVYVVDAFAGMTVSVIDGATCNASVHSGCGQTPATVTVAGYPQGVVVDERTDSVYVTNLSPTGGTVSVINGATCNGTVHSGCGLTPPAIPVGDAAGVPAVDEATDTIYVPNAVPSSAGSVYVIDGKTCSGTVHTGCARTPPTMAGGANSNAVAVDDATDTVYGTSGGATLGSVYVLDGAICNAAVTSGCGQTPTSVPVGSTPIDLAVDPLTQKVFVANEEDSTVSVIDGRICHARHTAGCAQQASMVTAGFNVGYLGVDLSTGTVYVTSQDLNDVWVLDGNACSAAHGSGCRHDAPTTTVGTEPNGIAVDQATHTAYVVNQVDSTLSVIDAATCNAYRRSSCGRTWPTVATGNFGFDVAVNQRTDTVYVTNLGANTVSVINGATCNATHTAGCDQTPATVPVGKGPLDLAVDQTTDTIYVANDNDNTVSVIDGATCNGTTTASCQQTPTTITVGHGPYGVDVDQRTDTIYVANIGDNTVSVIDGATCHTGRTTGCGQTPPTVAAGIAPAALAFNALTDTVYVEDQGLDNPFNDVEPETTSIVSVINGATCNADHTAGCGQTPATLVTGGNPFDGIAVDLADNTVYVDSLVDSAVDVFNGATCDGTHHAGCGQRPRSVPTGGWPSGIAVNAATGTVYASDNVDGQVSVFRAGRRRVR